MYTDKITTIQVVIYILSNVWQDVYFLNNKNDNTKA